MGRCHKGQHHLRRALIPSRIQYTFGCEETKNLRPARADLSRVSRTPGQRTRELLRSTLALRVRRSQTPRRPLCQNVRSGHGAKGHQSKSGKLLAAGEYVSSFTFASYQQNFQNDTYEKLLLLAARVGAKEAIDMSKEQAAAKVYRELLISPFFEHASRGDV
jgi:hypothetical protein